VGSQKGSNGPLKSWHTGKDPPSGGGIPALSVALGVLDNAVLDALAVRLAPELGSVVGPTTEATVLVAELPWADVEEAPGALFVEEALFNVEDALGRLLVAVAVLNDGGLAVAAVR
jgi:hypothetical protein